MAPTKSTLAALAGTALLGATAAASAQNSSCCGGGQRSARTTPTTSCCSAGNTISIEQRAGQAPVLMINGQRVDDRNVELTPDGRIFIHDGNGNRIDVLAQLGPMVNGGLAATPGAGPASVTNWSAVPQVDIKPVIGVRLQRVSPALAAHLDLADGTGVLIAGVHPDMPAAQAGLQQWDVITRVGGAPVDSANALTTMLSQVEPDTGVTVDCIRHGIATTVTVAPTMVEFPMHQTQRGPSERAHRINAIPAPAALQLQRQRQPLTPDTPQDAI